METYEAMTGKQTRGAGARLCLEAPIGRGGLSPAALEAALSGAPISAVLLTSPSDAALAAETAQPFVDLVQGHGAAAILTGDAAIVRALKADGVHIPWSEDVMDVYRAARDVLGAGFIVGAAAGVSRHDAMSLGEAGADYVAFHSGAEQLDLLSWWSEIFEVPGLALGVVSVADAQQVLETGVDFLSLPVEAGQPPADIKMMVAQIAGLIPDLKPVN